MGGPRFRILRGPRGGQIPSRHMTSMRRNTVASTSFRRHVPTRFLINQCQIITFLILKSDVIENSRIELRGIVLPLSSNQIKVTFIGRGGGGGGGEEQRVCWPPPPSQIIGGPAPPSSYAYALSKHFNKTIISI